MTSATLMLRHVSRVWPGEAISSVSESFCVQELGLSFGLDVEVGVGESEDVALDSGDDEGGVEEELKGRKTCCALKYLY